MEKLVLIDGNSLINRAFYAMPLLTTKDGVFTNAVYGFMNMFFKMVADIKPTYVAAAFDLKAPTFRHKLYSEYKGTRKPMPEELRPQIELLKEVLRLMGVAVIEKPGSEADDIIGTIAKHTDITTVIITGDKDSFQLVDEQTEVHFTRRGITDTEIYTNANFTEKTGIVPKQIIELKALMGDSSDNIPGIPGVGEKTALNLLQTYGDLDNLYSHVDELKGKLQEKVILGKELAYLSQKLATIDCDCGVCTDVDTMRFNMPLSAAVKKRFFELEFKTLYKKDDLFEVGFDQAENSQALGDSVVADLNSQTENEKKSIEIKEISSLDQLDFNSFKQAAFCLNKTKVYLSDGSVEYVIPVQESLLDLGFALSEVLSALNPLFTGKTPLITFNKKELRHYLARTVGIELCAPTDDVSIMKYIADFSGREEKFEEVIEDYSLSQQTPASSLFAIYKTLLNKLKADELLSLYQKVELPLADVLYQMEVSGFKVDQAALGEAGAKYRQILSELEEKIRALAEEPNLNVNSPMQLGVILFEKLKLGKGKKTSRGYSTTAEILESYENAHPIVPLILKYRQLQKLHSTYIEGFKPLIDKTTGLIHTSFNQTVTATGRLSSKEPNLQNIPVRDDEGREIRKFFVPKSDDRLLISADYSQIELRLLAAFSGCQSLITAFCEGKDIHAATAAKVFNVPLNQVSSSQRSNAKAVNFGVIYGISEYGLAKTLKIENYQAREYITSYFKEYPEVKKYMEQNVEFAKQTGYSKTMLGRRRYIIELSSPNHNIRQFGERVAMNMPLQGSSADIIKLAMLGVYNCLKKENLKSELILQIHDELIIDAYASEKDAVEKILVEEMENAAKLAVPLTVSVGYGKRWFDAK